MIKKPKIAKIAVFQSEHSSGSIVCALFLLFISGDIVESAIYERAVSPTEEGATIQSELSADSFSAFTEEPSPIPRAVMSPLSSLSPLSDSGLPGNDYWKDEAARTSAPALHIVPPVLPLTVAQVSQENIGSLSISVTETDDPVTVPPLTLATVSFPVGEMPRVGLGEVTFTVGVKVDTLFFSQPRLSLITTGVANGHVTALVVLQDGVVHADANGSWTVTVQVGEEPMSLMTVATVSIMATPDAPRFVAAESLTVGATETDAPVTITSVTVATGVYDVEGDVLSVRLSGGRSTPVSVGTGVSLFFETEPTVAFMQTDSDSDATIIWQGGVVHADANGVWTATVLLSDHDATGHSTGHTVSVGVVTVSVTATPDNPQYTLAESASLMVSLTETDAPVAIPTVTVATGVRDADGDVLTVLPGNQTATLGEVGASVTTFFETRPTLSLSGVVGDQSIIMTGGTINVDANGRWIEAILLESATDRISIIGWVTVTVTATSDDTRFTVAESLTVSLDEPDVPAVVPSLTVATGVYDPDGNEWGASLIGSVITLGEVGASVTTFFEIEPTLALVPEDGGAGSIVVLQGGVVHGDVNGVWTASVWIDEYVAGTNLISNSQFVDIVTVSIMATPDAPRFMVAESLTVNVNESDAPLAIQLLTVATGALDADGDVLSVSLSGVSSTPTRVGAFLGSFFETEPTASLAGIIGYQSIIVSGGTVAADANGVWTATVLLSDYDAMGDSAGHTVSVGVVTVSVTATPDNPRFVIADNLTVGVTETDAPVAIPSLTVATGVRDPDGDGLSVHLSDGQSTPISVGAGIDSLFETEPTLTLVSEDGGASSEIVLRGGVARADANGVWTATVRLSDGTGNTVSVGVATISVAATRDFPRFEPEVVNISLIETDAPQEIPLLTVATHVRDVDGDVLSIFSYANGNNLFVTEPTTSLAGVIGDQSIIVSGGTVAANASGEWMMTILLRSREITGYIFMDLAGMVTVSVTALLQMQMSENLTVSVTETDAPVAIPPLTVATGVHHMHGEVVTVDLLNGRSTPVSVDAGVGSFFATEPTLALVSEDGGASSEVVLRGGVARADANGVWTATVRLSSDTSTIDAVVTVSVTATPDKLRLTSTPIEETARTFVETDAPIEIPPLTMATGVRDPDGDVFMVSLFSQVTELGEVGVAVTSFFETEPTVMLSGVVGDQSIIVTGGTINADVNGVFRQVVGIVNPALIRIVNGQGFSVMATPDAPRFVAAENLTVGATETDVAVTVPSLTVATGVHDPDGNTLSVSLSGVRSTPTSVSRMVTALFATEPTVALVLSDDGASSEIVLRGGIANVDANGVWTATVLLSDYDAMGDSAGHTVSVGVVTVSVTAMSDAPRFTVAESLTVGVTETDAEVTIPLLTVATGVYDPDGDMLSVNLLNGATTLDAVDAIVPLLATEPTLALVLADGGASSGIVLRGGVARADINGVWMVTVRLSDDTGNTVSVGVVTISVAATPDNPRFTAEVLDVSLNEPDVPEEISLLTVVTNLRDPDGDTLSVFLVESGDDLFVTAPTISLAGVVGNKSVIVSGGTVAADANGMWTAAIVLRSEDESGNTAVESAGLVRISVTALPDVPRFVIADSLTVGVTETDAAVVIPSLTVATDVRDADGDVLSVSLSGVSATPTSVSRTVPALFATEPTLALVSEDGGASSGIVLRGGIANADANGVWTATVLLSDYDAMGDSAGHTVSVGVVTVSVAATPDELRFEGRDVTISLDEPDVPEEIELLTLITSVYGVDSDAVTVLPVAEGDALFATEPTVSLAGAIGNQSVIVSGGTVAANANGEWRLTVMLQGEEQNGLSRIAGFVTVSVAALPDVPQFVVAENRTVSLDEPDVPAVVPLLTVATDVRDVDGDALTATLTNPATTLGSVGVIVTTFFETEPTVMLLPADGGAGSIVVLRGGVVHGDVNGVWTATVRIGDGTGNTLSADVVTISVAALPDVPRFTAAESLSVGLAETDAPVAIRLLTVATGALDADGDVFSVGLSNIRSTPTSVIAGASSFFETEPTASLAGAIGYQSIIVSGGTVAADANGIWVATVHVSDNINTTIDVGLVTVSVAATPDAPRFTAAGSLSVGLAETDAPVAVPLLTVATDVRDVDGDMLSVSLSGVISTPTRVGAFLGSFFETEPTVELVLADGGGGGGIVLRDGVVRADFNGVWTATVLLSDYDAAGNSTGHTVSVGVVTVSVTATSDGLRYEGDAVNITLNEPDEPVALPPLTVITNLRNVDGNISDLAISFRQGALFRIDLFETEPTASLAGVDGNQSIIVSGGTVGADVNGVQLVAAFLTSQSADGSSRFDIVTLITLNVMALPDTPRFVIADSLTANATETDEPVTVPLLTVATEVRDVDGDVLTVNLSGVSSTPISVGAGVGALFATSPTVALVLSDDGADSEIVLRGGVANADANGVWTATVRLGDGTGTTVNVGVATVSVAATPDAPRFVAAERESLSLGLTETDVPVAVSSLTVATDVRDVDGDVLTVDLSGGRSTPISVGVGVDTLFETEPTVELILADGGASSGVVLRGVVLRGGVLRANFNGVWTATVLLSDYDAAGNSAGHTVSVGVVTVSVMTTPDIPQFVVAERLMVSVTEADAPVVVPLLTVANNVRDVDGDRLTVMLSDERSTPGVGVPRVFGILPQVTVLADPTAPVADIIVLQGATVAAYAYGVWTATVSVGDGTGNTVVVGVVTVSVRELEREVFISFSEGRDKPLILPAITVANNVKDNRAPLTVTLTDRSSTESELFSIRTESFDGTVFSDAGRPTVSLFTETITALVGRDFGGGASSFNLLLQSNKVTPSVLVYGQGSDVNVESQIPQSFASLYTPRRFWAVSRDTNGLWTATVVIDNGLPDMKPRRIPITITVTPVNDAPRFMVQTLSVVTIVELPENGLTLSPVIVANSLYDPEGDDISVSLARETVSVVNRGFFSDTSEMFSVPPTVGISGDSVTISSVVVNAIGRWTATVLLSDNAVPPRTRLAGIVTISLVAPNIGFPEETPMPDADDRALISMLAEDCRESGGRFIEYQRGVNFGSEICQSDGLPFSQCIYAPGQNPSESVPQHRGCVLEHRDYNKKNLPFNPYTPSYQTYYPDDSCSEIIPEGDVGYITEQTPLPCRLDIAGVCSANQRRLLYDSDTDGYDINLFSPCASLFIVTETSLTVAQDDEPVPVPVITVATDVVNVNGEVSNSVFLQGPSENTDDLFSDEPVLSLDESDEIILSGATVRPFAIGKWTVTVFLDENGGQTSPLTVAVVTIVSRLNSQPTFVSEDTSIEVNETDAPVSVPPLTVAANVVDEENNPLTVSLENMQSTPGVFVDVLFETAPTLVLAHIPESASSGLVLQGGVTPADANGVWTATVVLRDDVSTPVTVGVATISVAPVNDAPVFAEGTLSVTVAEDTPGVVPTLPLTVATDVDDIDNAFADLTVMLLNVRSTPTSVGLDVGDAAIALFATAPTVSLDVDTSVIVLQDGVLNADANGVWTATVLLSDGGASTAASVTVGVVTISVTAENDAPTFAVGTLSVTMAEDTPGAVPTPPLTLATDVGDIDNAIADLTVSLTDRSSTESALFATAPTVSLESSGVGTNVIVLQDGVLNADANGVWTATVELSDSVSTPVTVGVVTVSVTAENDAPTFAAGTLSVTVAEDTAGAVPTPPLTVATDVGDIDNAPADLTVMLLNGRSTPTSVGLDVGDAAIALFATAPTVSLDVDTSVIVLQDGVLNADANGVWTATVELSDGVSTPVTVGVVTVSVTAENDAPTFAVGTLSVTMAEDTPGAVPTPPLTVATDVGDIDNAPADLTVMLLNGRSTPTSVGLDVGDAVIELFETTPTVSLDVGASVIVLQDGVLNADANGVWTATVLLSDGGEATAASVTVGVVTVSVTAENDAPVFAAGTLSVTVAEDTPGAVPSSALTLATDVSDIDNVLADLTVMLLNVRSTPTSVGVGVGALFATLPGVSLDVDTSVIVLQDGALNADANGVWTATVELSDGDASTAASVAVGVVTISVTAENDAPVFALAALSVSETETDITVNIPELTVATGVYDADGDVLTVSLKDEQSTPGAFVSELFETVPTVSLYMDADTGTSVIVLEGGVARANANGVWTATVELSDGPAPTAVSLSVGVVTISVTAVNDAPTFAAGTLSVTVAEDTPGAVPTPALTLATDVGDIDNALADLTVSLTNRSDIESALFATSPTVSLYVDADTGASVIVLQDGTLNADANGVWTATVLLSDGRCFRRPRRWRWVW